jgi:hypothetical protein
MESTEEMLRLGTLAGGNRDAEITAKENLECWR